MIVEESVVTLATPSGAMRTFVVAPKVVAGSRAKFPGLVFFSEIFQRTQPITRMATMMAGHGFTVYVPEIFHELEPAGTVLPYDAAGTDAGNRHKKEKSAAAFDEDARACVDHLLAREDASGNVVTMGVCIGGHLAFRCALDPRVRAAACFYATDLHTATLGKTGDDSLARASAIKGELMMVWGRQDPHVDEAGRVKIQDALKKGNVNFTWHELNAAHAFLRDEGPRYDPALALTSYRLALDLFSRVR